MTLIIERAKRIWPGVHVMRALASRFFEEDYRLYDIDCGDSEEIEQRQVSSEQYHREVSIRPNPSHGNIIVDIGDYKMTSQLYVTDIVGNTHHVIDNPEHSHRLQLPSSGVYLITIKYNDGFIVTEKILVVD